MAAKYKQRRGAVVLLSALCTLAVSHVGVTGLIEFARPDWRDAEYGYRMAYLKQRLVEAPDRPLVLCLGSSRTLNAVAADDLAPWTSAGGPLVFNMGLPGAGPINQLICLRNLLEQGICPRAVTIEVLPIMLSATPDGGRTNEGVAEGRCGWQHLDILPAEEARKLWLGAVTPPWFAYRFSMMIRGLPNWIPAGQGKAYYRTSDFGWLNVPPEIGLQSKPVDRMQRAFTNCAPHMRFTTIHPQADAVLRVLLDTCRQHHIEILSLIVMPESQEVRSWYAPGTAGVIDAYLTRLAADYGTRFVNAREWLADECFFDGHHQYATGAHQFTARLRREVFEPWAHAR